MKSILILTVALSSFVSIAQAQVPSDDSVNKWVDLALRYDEAKLTNTRGRVTCQSMSGVSASDDNVEMARGKVLLLCIKKKCAGVQDEVNAYIDELRRKSAEERADIVAGLGAEDQAALIERVLRGGGYGGTTSCQTSQTARYLAYDSCVVGQMCSR